MSQGAVLQAVRDTLQTTFDLDANSCEVGLDGSPKPSAGEFYIAVHPLGWNTASGDWDLGEEYQIGVTLTMRIGFAPSDRRGIAVWLACQDGRNPAGMEQRLRTAIAAIHQNQAVRMLANQYLSDAASSMGGGGILTALWFMNVSAPRLQGPDWFSAPPPETDGQVAECGLSQTITFGKCQRVQDIPDME